MNDHNAQYHAARLRELSWFMLGYRAACADTFEKECPIGQDHLAALEGAQLALVSYTNRHPEE
jgi:hypothetical protein